MSLSGSEKIRIIGVSIKSDGQTVDVVETDSEEKNTTVQLRCGCKIIPYLLIDKYEDEESYHITALRDPKTKIFYCKEEREGRIITTHKLKYNGLNSEGKMTWRGVLF